MRYSEIMGQKFDGQMNNIVDNNNYDTDYRELKDPIINELRHSLNRETIINERNKICPVYRIHILISFISIGLPTIYFVSLINGFFSLTNHSVVNYLIITFSVANIFVIIGFTIVLNMLNCGLIWNIELDKDMPKSLATS